MVVNSNPPVFLITTLAEYQTVFWLAVAQELRLTGRSVAFLSFDDRSTEILEAAGFETFSARPDEMRPVVDDASFSAAMLKYEIQKTNFWFTHERITFGIRDSGELRRKLLAYLALAERACTTLVGRGNQVTLVQELGGFISVIASFYAARRNCIDNWFVEPSFFRGRMIFLRNSFAAQRGDGSLPSVVSVEMQDYLKKTLADRKIAVPKKDRHQYTTAFRKVVNTRNLKRLMVKLYDKYVFNKHQEFGYIGQYVRIHAKMLLNSFRMRTQYTSLEQIDRFVYYPLHVPADMALTLRSPQYLDQIALVAYLARIVPDTHKIVIKEHPAMIGALDANRILDLLGCYDNVKMLAPSTNNFDVLMGTDVVISVNSKSGAEAALLGKPVLVLGDAFYSNSPLVQTVENLIDLPEILEKALKHRSSFDKTKVEQYFESVWNASFPGELYITDPDNIRVFKTSLINALEHHSGAVKSKKLISATESQNVE